MVNSCLWNFPRLLHPRASVLMVQMSIDGIVRGWADCTDYLDGCEYRLTLAPPRDPLQRLIAGGIAGGISRTGAEVALLLHVLSLFAAIDYNTD